LTDKLTVGKLGEDLACNYLRRKGYKIIERNYRKVWGELDIIAVSPTKMLIFVEVKTINGPNAVVSPEEQLTRAKKIKLDKMAQFYANRLTDSNVLRNGWRIDLIAITKVTNAATIRHYKNI